MKCFLAQGSSRNQQFFLGPTALFIKEGECMWSPTYVLFFEYLSTYFYVYSFWLIFQALRLFPDLCLFQILEYDCPSAVIEKVFVEILDTKS